MNDCCTIPIGINPACYLEKINYKKLVKEGAITKSEAAFCERSEKLGFQVTLTGQTKVYGKIIKHEVTIDITKTR